MIVQNMFASNLQNPRDLGINILSNEDQYRFNYAFGIWGWRRARTSRATAHPSARTCYPQPELPEHQLGNNRTYNYDTRFHERRADVYGPVAV